MVCLCMCACACACARTRETALGAGGNQHIKAMKTLAQDLQFRIGEDLIRF